MEPTDRPRPGGDPTPPTDHPPGGDDPFAGVEDPGFFAEFWDFLKTSKKWWMLPLLAVFLLMGLLLVLAQTAAAPFIYTLF